MESRSIQTLHIICYKWGTLYSAEYVNILAAMVARHLSWPHTFHCITDSRDGLAAGIEVHELPDLGFEGIWRKLMTFKNNFLGLQGEFVVSIDIDVVITGSLDFLAEHPKKDFIIAKNWVKGGTRGSGSLYRLKVGSHTEIWDDFIADPEQAIDRFHGKNRLVGEQNWLNTHFDAFEYFPENKVVSYKRHCNAKGRVLEICGREIINTANFGCAVVPDEAALVSFHGDPSPLQVAEKRFGRWRHAPFVKEHWHL